MNEAGNSSIDTKSVYTKFSEVEIGQFFEEE